MPNFSQRMRCERHDFGPFIFLVFMFRAARTPPLKPAKLLPQHSRKYWDDFQIETGPLGKRNLPHFLSSWTLSFLGRPNFRGRPKKSGYVLDQIPGSELLNVVAGFLLRKCAGAAGWTPLLLCAMADRHRRDPVFVERSLPKTCWFFAGKEFGVLGMNRKEPDPLQGNHRELFSFGGHIPNLTEPWKRHLIHARPVTPELYRSWVGCLDFNFLDYLHSSFQPAKG